MWLDEGMTTTQPGSRVQVRLLSMSTEEIQSLLASDDRFVWTEKDAIRRQYMLDMLGWELNRRQIAGGR